MKGMPQFDGFSSDFATEFPDYFPQIYGTRYQSAPLTGLQNQLTAIEDGTQQQLVWPDHSSNTRISRLGPQAPAFYATEIYTGLSEFGSQEKNSTCCSQQFNHSYTKIPVYQEPGDGFMGYAPEGSEPDFQPSNNLSIWRDGLYNNPFGNLSMGEQILHLKNKLLGDLDDSDRRSPYVPFDANQDLGVTVPEFTSFNSSFDETTPLSFFLASFTGDTKFIRISFFTCSTSKTRIRWTQDLHDIFVESVNRLGGYDSNTKGNTDDYGYRGLTIFHVKSHLQKYRNAKYIPESVEEISEKKISTNNVAHIDIKTGIQLKEALQLQLDIQKCLHEQLESQRVLQMRIQEQAKQLKMMLDQQQKTTPSFTESTDPNNECPSFNISATMLEDLEIVDLDSCDDDKIFPFKIS